MEFEFMELGRGEAEVQAVFDVCKEVFANVSLSKLRSNWLDSHPGSTFIGAFHGEKLAAVNGFLAHPVMIDAVPALAFQSCWSATRAEYRGKGLFTRVINEAKLRLEGKCAFLCGFPNATSGPIFTKKLGFHSTPMVRNLILARGPERALQGQIDVDRWFADLEERSLVRFDQYWLSDWKRSENEAQVEIEHNTNFIWGRVGLRRVAGMNVEVFIAGGIELNKPQLFGRLMQEVARSTGSPLVRFVSAGGSLASNGFRFTRHADRTEPFIYFPIDNAVDELRFDAHTGMKDVY